MDYKLIVQIWEEEAREGARTNNQGEKYIRADARDYSVPCVGAWSIDELVVKLIDRYERMTAGNGKLEIKKILGPGDGVIDGSDTIEEHFESKLQIATLDIAPKCYTLKVVREPACQEEVRWKEREGTVSSGGSTDFRKVTGVDTVRYRASPVTSSSNKRRKLNGHVVLAFDPDVPLPTSERGSGMPSGSDDEAVVTSSRAAIRDSPGSRKGKRPARRHREHSRRGSREPTKSESQSEDRDISKIPLSRPETPLERGADVDVVMINGISDGSRSGSAMQKRQRRSSATQGTRVPLVSGSAASKHRLSTGLGRSASRAQSIRDTPDRNQVHVQAQVHEIREHASRHNQRASISANPRAPFSAAKNVAQKRDRREVFSVPSQDDIQITLPMTPKKIARLRNGGGELTMNQTAAPDLGNADAKATRDDFGPGKPSTRVSARAESQLTEPDVIDPERAGPVGDLDTLIDEVSDALSKDISHEVTDAEQSIIHDVACPEHDLPEDPDQLDGGKGDSESGSELNGGEKASDAQSLIGAEGLETLSESSTGQVMNSNVRREGEDEDTRKRPGVASEADDLETNGDELPGPRPDSPDYPIAEMPPPKAKSPIITRERSPTPARKTLASMQQPIASSRKSLTPLIPGVRRRSVSFADFTTELLPSKQSSSKPYEAPEAATASKVKSVPPLHTNIATTGAKKTGKGKPPFQTESAIKGAGKKAMPDRDVVQIPAEDRTDEANRSASKILVPKKKASTGTIPAPAQNLPEPASEVRYQASPDPYYWAKALTHYNPSTFAAHKANLTAQKAHPHSTANSSPAPLEKKPAPNLVVSTPAKGKNPAPKPGAKGKKKADLISETAVGDDGGTTEVIALQAGETAYVDGTEVKDMSKSNKNVAPTVIARGEAVEDVSNVPVPKTVKGKVKPHMDDEPADAEMEDALVTKKLPVGRLAKGKSKETKTAKAPTDVEIAEAEIVEPPTGRSFNGKATAKEAATPTAARSDEVSEDTPTAKGRRDRAKRPKDSHLATGGGKVPKASNSGAEKHSPTHTDDEEAKGLPTMMAAPKKDRKDATKPKARITSAKKIVESIQPPMSEDEEEDLVDRFARNPSSIAAITAVDVALFDPPAIDEQRLTPAQRDVDEVSRSRSPARPVSDEDNNVSSVVSPDTSSSGKESSDVSDDTESDVEDIEPIADAQSANTQASQTRSFTTNRAGSRDDDDIETPDATPTSAQKPSPPKRSPLKISTQTTSSPKILPRTKRSSSSSQPATMPKALTKATMSVPLTVAKPVRARFTASNLSYLSSSDDTDEELTVPVRPPACQLWPNEMLPANPSTEKPDQIEISSGVESDSDSEEVEGPPPKPTYAEAKAMGLFGDKLAPKLSSNTVKAREVTAKQVNISSGDDSDSDSEEIQGPPPKPTYAEAKAMGLFDDKSPANLSPSTAKAREETQSQAKLFLTQAQTPNNKRKQDDDPLSSQPLPNWDAQGSRKRARLSPKSLSRATTQGSPPKSTQEAADEQLQLETQRSTELSRKAGEATQTPSRAAPSSSASWAKPPSSSGRYSLTAMKKQKDAASTSASRGIATSLPTYKNPLKSKMSKAGGLGRVVDGEDEDEEEEDEDDDTDDESSQGDESDVEVKMPTARKLVVNGPGTSKKGKGKGKSTAAFGKMISKAKARTTAGAASRR